MKLNVLLPVLTCLLGFLDPRGTAAQEQDGALQLAILQQQAVAADPRLRQVQLEAARTELRLLNIAAEQRPSITAEGHAQYQSDVPTFPFQSPAGQPSISPPNDTYDAYLRIEQRLLDPTVRARFAVERAQLAEAQARVQTTLFGLRQQVNESFFAAALLQERAGTLAATITDLETRLRETAARVREGSALAGEAAAVEATLLQRRQDEAELRASRQAALARLAELIGRAIGEDDVLRLPDVADAVAQARGALADVRARPEYEQFGRTRDRLARQQDLAAVQDQPRVSAFARAGYARPGLNFIGNRFDSYVLAGVQVQWKLWNWGTTEREREALSLQQQIVLADEAAFTGELRRTVQNDLVNIDRLKDALVMDDRIIALREGIERGQRARFQEGVVTAAEYVDRTTELLAARFAQAAHRVELAQASARFLTTLGLEVR